MSIGARRNDRVLTFPSASFIVPCRIGRAISHEENPRSSRHSFTSTSSSRDQQIGKQRYGFAHCNIPQTKKRDNTGHVAR